MKFCSIIFCGSLKLKYLGKNIYTSYFHLTLVDVTKCLVNDIKVWPFYIP